MSIEFMVLNNLFDIGFPYLTQISKNWLHHVTYSEIDANGVQVGDTEQAIVINMIKLY